MKGFAIFLGLIAFGHWVAYAISPGETLRSFGGMWSVFSALTAIGALAFGENRDPNRGPSGPQV